MWYYTIFFLIQLSYSLGVFHYLHNAFHNSNVQYPVEVSMGKTEYPTNDEIISHMKTFTKNIKELDAMDLAKKAGSSRSMNMVMFGALLGTELTPLKKELALEVVRSSFSSKFESINLTAVDLGYETVQKLMMQ